MSVGENMCSTYQKMSLVNVMLKHGENMLQLKKTWGIETNDSGNIQTQ